MAQNSSVLTSVSSTGNVSARSCRHSSKDMASPLTAGKPTFYKTLGIQTRTTVQQKMQAKNIRQLCFCNYMWKW